MTRRSLPGLAAGLLLASAAFAQDARIVDVRFPAGATGTTIEDRIRGYGSVEYKVGAEAGQSMTVALDPSNLATYFNVYPPGRGPGDEALVNGQFTDPPNRFEDTLETSGEYTISVYMMRSAARRDEVSDYALDISVAGDTGAVVEGDYADGLQGGPDFLEVATGGGVLNLRAGPSAGADLMTQLPSGTNVRNLGCRMAEGRRWCRIATLADPGEEGWAAGDFLIEGSGAPAPPAASAGRPGGSSQERVRFEAGASGAELTGSLAPGESRRYVLGARSGQDLYVRVAPRGPGISYQIFNPDGSFLLDRMSPEREYRGELWQSGDHAVEVINRGDSETAYNVIVGIE